MQPQDCQTRVRPIGAEGIYPRGDVMRKAAFFGGLLGLSMLAVAPAASEAAVYAPPAIRTANAPAGVVSQAQFWPRGPRFAGPRFIGPRRGFVYARPWVRRPYYGRIVAGVALGTIVTVAAVGLIPRRPAPDLCWYWADPYRNRGYWDYCY
jgi:hypothetical protein